MDKKHPKLIGMSFHDERELNSMKEVADYICEKGVSGDVTITYEDGTPFLNTFGIYIDRISDMNYRSELLKILIPMQQALDGTAEIGVPEAANDDMGMGMWKRCKLWTNLKEWVSMPKECRKPIPKELVLY